MRIRGKRTFKYLVAEKDAVHDAHAFGIGQKVITNTDKTAGRDRKVHKSSTALNAHIFHLAKTLTHHFNYHAAELLRYFNG